MQVTKGKKSCGMGRVVALVVALVVVQLFGGSHSDDDGAVVMDNMRFETTMRIGAVLDLGSRMGKEQKIAMEIAAQEFNYLLFHFHHSHGSSAASVAAVMDLARSKQVQAIIGTITHSEATMAVETNNASKNLPILSLTSLAVSRDTDILPYFIQLGTDITYHIRCFAAIVEEFKWPKVTVIYEQNNGVFSDPKILTLFSHSLRLVGAEIVDHSALPSLHSLSNPRVTIERELSRLKSNNNRVFLVVQASLEMANLLLKMAKQMGLMGKESVWIVPDEVAGLIDSANPSFILNMLRVIGFKSHFNEMSETVRQFRFKFRRKFALEYPEEENINPSIFALRSYDAIWAIALAAKKSQRKFSQGEFSESILASNFEGLSGKISFKNGKLLRSQAFEIINVIGKSYRDLAFWSPPFGFSMNLARHQLMEGTKNNDSIRTLETVHWRGNLLSVPKGWTFANEGKTLRIGVPAKGAFTQFVNVTCDQSRNETSITGFSIDVFKAAVERLPYHLQYEFIPVNCSYDEMVQKVYKKELDAAVGDTEIMAYRYRYVIFSQPYVESDLHMVVTVKPNKSKEAWMFTSAFTKEAWLVMAAMHIFIGFIIWLMERQVNEQLRGLGAILWFLVTVIFYAHREPIKNPFARIVLAPWLFVILILTTSFTASLTSMMTISQLEPSVLDIQTLQRTNAPVGCNGNSFIVRYLIDVLKFKPKNIRKIDSISDYPTAFKKRDIEAAFFVAPHAKVFLAKYSCAGFVKAGDTFKLGGFGFAFPKDSSKLASDISEAVLNVIEDGETQLLEDDMISTVSCSTLYDKNQEDRSLGIQPFLGLFYISAIVAVLAVLAWSYSIKDLLISELRNWMSHMQETLSHFWIILLWRGIKAFMAQMYSEFQTGIIRRSSISGTNDLEETASSGNDQSRGGTELVHAVMITHAPS